MIRTYRQLGGRGTARCLSLSLSPNRSESGSRTFSNYVITREVDNIGIIELNDPDRMNAMTVEMGEAFKAAVERYSILASEQKIRAVIVKGKGRAFSAGGDLDWLKARSQASVYENNLVMVDFYNRFLCIRNLKVPTIASIHGPAIGAGLAMALACDFRVAAEDAKMGVTFASLGIHPGMGSSVLLPRLIGHQHAAYLHLSGAILNGTEAREVKLVLQTAAAKGGSTSEKSAFLVAMKMATDIAGKAPIAVRSAMLTLRNDKFRDIESALEREADCQALCYKSEDFLKGIEAVRTKTPAEFVGW